MVRTFISFPAGVARMPIGRFIVFSTLGRVPVEHVLVWVGEQLGANWEDLRHKLQPFDSLILVVVVGLVRDVHLVAHRHAGPPAARRASGDRFRGLTPRRGVPTRPSRQTPPERPDVDTALRAEVDDRHPAHRDDQRNGAGCRQDPVDPGETIRERVPRLRQLIRRDRAERRGIEHGR